MITVVIPARNERKNLERLLNSLDNYSSKIEVLVVDNCSNDSTDILVKSKSYARYIGKISTPGEARNIGIKEAKHDRIAMLDADTELIPGWLEQVEWSLDWFDIVAGYSPDPKGKQLPRVPILVEGQDITYPQCNIAYRRELFEEIGYLREDMSVAEDCEFHYRCVKSGKNIFYNPKMKVYHYERPNLRQWIRKCIKNGFGRYELERIHPYLKHRSQHGLKLRTLFRLGFGALGYLKGKLFGGRIKT